MERRALPTTAKRLVGRPATELIEAEPFERVNVPKRIGILPHAILGRELRE